MPKRAADVALILGLAVLYVILARLGLLFHAVSRFASLIWAPSGIALAALLLRGYRMWPGLFIGAVTANVLTGAPVAAALAIGAGNTLEAVVATYLLRRVPQFSLTLETVTSALALIVLGALLSTTISATIGLSSLYASRMVTTHLDAVWRAWWLGDMVAILLVTPTILVWANKRRARLRTHIVEVIALGAAMVDISAMVFFNGSSRIPNLATPFHELDVLLAVLIWAALRFGPRGAATAVLGVSATAIAGTTLGYGPFAEVDVKSSLFLVQTFMAIVAAIFLLLGATVAERRYATDEAQRAREEAARANLGKSEFLAVMSHELRTPLNAIAGYADLLSAGLYGPLNKKQTDAIASIHRNERQLLSVIDEVFGFVRAEKGEITVKTEDVGVEQAFDAVEPLLEPEFQRKQFVVKRDLARPVAVHADPKSLQQILVSLLSNASKYTSDGGEITLGARREGRKVRIWVSDTGVGIPETEIRRVFEPFFQAERGPTRRYAGVGLGLTIARDLARRMDGEVTIASKVGEGTTASVVLPAA